jgi:hypothetical protein
MVVAVGVTGGGSGVNVGEQVGQTGQAGVRVRASKVADVGIVSCELVEQLIRRITITGINIFLNIFIFPL